jgi:hypothetical protein
MVPYPGLTNPETVTAVQKGFQMEKPEKCPEEVYAIMKECWNLDPHKRPTFVEVCKRINNLYRKSAGSNYATITELKKMDENDNVDFYN